MKLPQLNVISTGLKLFEFNSRLGECPFRLCQEGLKLIRPYLTKRIVQAPLEDFIHVLQTQQKPEEIKTFSVSVQKQLEGMKVGSCVFELEQEDTNQEQEDIKPSQPDSYSGLMCVVWRGINKSVYVRLVIRSVNILVSEIEIKQYKRLLGVYRVCFDFWILRRITYFCSLILDFGI